jgi:aryl-alcohol dehydrogenase-like predicted oxidoreductase
MPLASGALTGKYTATHRPMGWRRHTSLFRGPGLERLDRVNAVLRELATQHDKTPSQVALRWLIQKDVLPIPGAKTGPQATENVGALSFVLSDTEMDTLSRTTAPGD